MARALRAALGSNSPVQVYPRSAKPYEVQWRPFDSSGCELAANPQKRIALIPRLYVGRVEEEERIKAGEPPAGSKPWGYFLLTEKTMRLNVPPIASWCLAHPDQPWSDLGPFAF